MATKPQRKARVTKEQMRAQGSAVADTVTALIVAAIGAERRRNRRYFAALWAAVIALAVLALV